MTRINTNVSSLVGRNNLASANADLSQSLTRLSTGLRINTGKDDPAGLIASENLRSDITSIRRAISNTDRANQVIATADSALGQVSSLLNDIRGLVTESANSGALSEEQIEANQLQVDSSLEALNRIAQTTTFQGRRLLDGSLDFVTTQGSNFSNLSDLQIDQANLGATGSVAVDIEVTTAATQAQVDVASVPGATAAVNAQGSLVFDAAAAGSTGTVGIATSAKQASGTFGIAGETFDVNILATSTNLANAAGNGLTIAIVDDDNGNAAASAVTSAVVAGTTLTITGDFSADSNLTAGTLATQVDAILDAGGTGDLTFALASGGTAGTAVQTTTIDAQSYSGGTDAATQNITVTGVNGVSSNVQIDVVEDTGVGATPTVTGDATNGYTVRVDDSVDTTLADIATAIQGITEVQTAVAAAPAAVYNGGTDTALNSTLTTNLTGGRDAGSDIITINADAAGTGGNRTITFAEANLGNDVIDVTDDGTTIAIQVDDTSTFTFNQIADAINAATDGFTASVTQSAGNGTYDSANDTAPTGGDLNNLAGGVTGSGGLTSDIVIELAGSLGSEVLSFGTGSSIADLVSGINLVSDATGVAATANGTTLELRSSGYGDDAVVDVSVIEDDTSLFSDARDEGSDVVASVNGVAATGNGNELSINTATLDLSTTVAAGFTGTASFTITGGGALFQLGPDVVSNQQARLGIGSVNTARLGGVSGSLFQLGTGGAADLSTDANTAASIVEEAIDQVTSLRGRLGAFQRTTLETNQNALNDTLTNLTEAESSIRDADFAVETAELTRSQILVQSSTQVLAIANQNPQNVLALLG